MHDRWQPGATSGVDARSLRGGRGREVSAADGAEVGADDTVGAAGCAHFLTTLGSRRLPLCQLFWRGRVRPGPSAQEEL